LRSIFIQHDAFSHAKIVALIRHLHISHNAPYLYFMGDVQVANEEDENSDVSKDSLRELKQSRRQRQ